MRIATIPVSVVAACLAVAVSAPGSARERGRDRNAVPVAVPDGAPRSCVPITQLRDSLVRNNRVIDFRVAGDRYYRVTLPQDCPGLGFERRFAYATSLSQLCQQDIITVLYQNPIQRGASCGLAPFQPVRIARRR